MVIHPLLGYALAVTVRGFAGSFWGYYVRHVRGYSDYGLGVGPMWFVVVLLIFTILYGLWRQLAKPATNPPQGDSKAPGNVAIAVFALGLGLVTWVVRIWYPIDRWVTILLMPVEIAHLPQYIILFVIGIIAYRPTGSWGYPMPWAKCGWGSLSSVSCCCPSYSWPGE
jgi:glucan biosynthesis protein C